jgi:hypothetical protein
MANKYETPKALSKRLIRRITKESARPNELRDAAFRRRILSVPKVKVVTYGQVEQLPPVILYITGPSRDFFEPHRRNQYPGSG